ncbi:MAG: iron-sulfur cluster repair di-iron protein [Isosphaeraceae bacterium]
MTTITPETPVGQLVADDPRRAHLFERLGIDYCCGGRSTLDRACREKGLDVAAVLHRLAAGADEAEPYHDEHWAFDEETVTLGELMDHIVMCHHAYLYRELPRLAALARQVVGAHGNRHPELREVRDIFDSLKEDLKLHLLKEEKELFPRIARLEAANRRPGSARGPIGNPILATEHEHEEAGAALARLHTLTDGYTPPADACPTYRALLDGLARLEADLHLHIHEENNILFPRARAIEAALQITGTGSD